MNASAFPPPAPEAPVAKLPATLPIRFIDAMFADRCLHFVGDPLGIGGPDMPVCGAERAQDASPYNRYCRRHLNSVAELPAILFESPSCTHFSKPARQWA